MEIINKITLDMASAGMPTYIDAVQGDTLTRKVEITLMTRGQVFDPSGGLVSISVAFKKPDGTSGWYDTLPDGSIAATVISDGVYLVSLAPEMLTVPGNVCAVFRFYLDSRTISTFPFFVRVSENPSFDSSKSENYYNVQTWDDVNASFDEIFDRLAKLEQSDDGANIDDTNISTETTWSSKNIVDKLVPAFEESGSIVTCQPVEGYPLTVQTEEGATKVIRCGKNLLDYRKAYARNSDQTVTIDESIDGLEWTGDYYFIIPVSVPAGTIVVFSCESESDDGSGTIAIGQLCSADGTQVAWCNNGLQAVVTGDASYIRVRKMTNIEVTGTVKVWNLQLEVDTVATPYKQYQGGEFGVGETIPALKDVNYLMADSGNITVTGRADPNAVIADIYEKLNAVLATTAALTGV